MIVDCHVHPGLTLDDRSSAEKEFGRLLDCMERVEIDKACVSPMVTGAGSTWYFPGKEHVAFSAECLAEIMENQADRFYSLLWLNPYHDVEFSVGLVRKYILEGNINGVKLWTEMNARDKKLDALVDFLELHDIPVLFHCFYHTWGKSFFESDPSDIADLAGRHPGLRIVMAHLRGCRYRGVQDIKGFPNVSIDTSGSGAEDGYLEYALKELGPDRILFGSDYPGRDFAAQRARIDTLELPPEVRNKLFCDNAVKIFGRHGK